MYCQLEKYCPDYEIIEWNEDNFDVNRNAYTQMCYKEKKYAFLTDYLRLLIVEEHGGIYFDTDVEAVRSFDELLDNPAFFGFENDRFVNTGEGFGAEPHNPAVRQMLAEYDPLLDGQHGTIGCPRLNTDALLKLGLELNGEKQKLSGAVVFPEDFSTQEAASPANCGNGEYPFDPLVFGKLDAMAQAAAVGDQQTGAFYPGEGKRTWQMIQSG